MISVMIVDIGGTLIGAPDIIKELSKVFEEIDAYDQLRLELRKEFVAIERGEKIFATVEEILQYTLSIVSKKLGCPDKSHLVREIYSDTFVTQSYLFEHTVNFLEYLKKNNIKIIVATNADADLIHLEFRKHDLEQYFDYILISSDLNAYKPDDSFVKALREIITEPLEEVMFVGDTTADILTGQKLGVKTALIGRDTAGVIHPDYSIQDLQELIEIVERINAEEDKGIEQKNKKPYIKLCRERTKSV